MPASVLDYKLVDLGADTLDTANYNANAVEAWIANAMRFAYSGARLNKDVPQRTQEDVDLFQIATENKGRDAGFSTCGNVVGCVTSLVGCTDERFLNRSDDDLDGVPDAAQKTPGGGAIAWRTGMNITMFIEGARALGAWRQANANSDEPLYRLPSRGFPFFMGENGREHVGIFVSDPVVVLPGTFAIDTIEGGQVGSAGEQQAQFFHRMFQVQSPGSSKYIMRGRGLHGWVDVTKLPYSRHAMVPPDFDRGIEVDGTVHRLPLWNQGRGRWL